MLDWRVANALVELRKQVNLLVPKRNKLADGTIGNAEHASRSSDHNPWVHDKKGQPIVTACDITHDPKGGFDSYAFAEFARQHWDNRTKYIISNRRIANAVAVTKGGKKYGPREWSPYSGKNPHDHHVHISVQPKEILFDDVKPWQIGFAGKVIKPEEAPETPQYPKLFVGNTGEYVKVLQQHLHIDDDGFFGQDTRAAVKALQKEAGLDEDGIVGVYTWKAVLQKPA